MQLINQIIESGSYYGIFVLVFGLNVVPFLMPPTWIVLASIAAGYPSFSPLLLALAGATASVAGRFALLILSSGSRKIMSEKRRNSLDAISRYLKGKKYGYFIVSFIFALGPLPSNILFIGYGIMKTRTAGMFIGFWLGRVISYFVLISVFSVAFKPVIDIFYDRLVGIALLDSVGIASVIAFACVDWEKLIIERKVVFLKPSLRP